MFFRLAMFLTALLSYGVICHAEYYPSYAQYLGHCGGNYAPEQALEASIQRYHEHIDRLAEKFVTGFYGQSDRKKQLREINLGRVLKALEALAPRRTAALFYAFAGSSGQKEDSLCIWLISPYLKTSRSGFVHVKVPITLYRLESLRANIVNSFGVIALARDIMPLAKREVIETIRTEPLDPTRALADAASVLLPQPVLSGLQESAIDTLVVLPIFDVGAIPFGALPIDKDRTLIDMVSVVVAPGFFVFLDPPHAARTTFPNAIVVANPDGWTSDEGRAAPLPNAQREAQAIADKLKINAAQVFTSDAMLKKIRPVLAAKPGPSLVYIAAHGRADEENPLDGSYLLLRDGPWKAKDIGKLNLGGSQPLVVLSACQTGLGKNFEVGNIGIARAWNQAGASNVVMSLWSVYKPSTQDMMSHFTGLLPSCPADKALRAAMLRARQRFIDPAQWAGFSVYGLPERPAALGWNDPARCGERAP
jgi:hypothetical protein